MKKVLILPVMIILVLLISINALGAIQNSGDGSATLDHWYSVEPDTPYFVGNYYGVNQETSSIGILNFEFFQNDQNFFNYNYTLKDSIGKFNISGSFLSESGFFFGAGLVGIEDHYMDAYIQQVTLSPGFRAAIDDKSYLAASFDFVTDGLSSEISSYEISGKFFAEGYKIAGKYISYPNMGQMATALEGDLVVSEHIITGFDADYTSSNQAARYIAGLTYAGETLTVDAQYGYASQYQDYLYSVNGVFDATEFLRFGVTYTKYNQDLNGCLIIKAQLGTDDSKFVFKYNSANDDYYEALTLAYEHKFEQF